MEKIYTPEEVSKILKVSYKKCLELINNEEIESFVVGKVRRITEKQISDYIKKTTKSET